MKVIDLEQGPDGVWRVPDHGTPRPRRQKTKPNQRLRRKIKKGDPERIRARTCTTSQR